jgi:hypothetical protein
MTLAPLCLECGTRSVLTDGREVYPHRPDLFDRLYYRCRACGASCGTHRGTDRPLGSPAGGETKRARAAAHAIFDPLWQAKIRRDGCSKSKARNAGYQWLAEQLGMPKAKCHIGMMDEATARRVVEVCRAARKR